MLLPSAAPAPGRGVLSSRRCLRTLQEFKIQNMVGSCDVKFPIRLEGLASTHAMFCSVSGRRVPCLGAPCCHVPALASLCPLPLPLGPPAVRA